MLIILYSFRTFIFMNRDGGIQEVAGGMAAGYLPDLRDTSVYKLRAEDSCWVSCLNPTYI